MHHYTYDASGERVLKASSDYESTYQNGTPSSPATISFNGYTTYPSAFMVITADGVFSKHYYAGSQRILSRLGNTTASLFGTPCTSCSSCPTNSSTGRQDASSKKANDKQQQQAQIADLQFYADLTEKGKVEFKQYTPLLLEDQERVIADENASQKTTEKTANTNRTAQIPLPAEPIYYYHSDHLGTSTFLTDANGVAYQFFLNLPFGETMAEQLGTSYYKNPYKFNGKELDEETGLYYYGARYYDPKTSIWLSTDPLAEKYPAHSPYVYTFNNPVRYNDPDGKEPTPYEAALMAAHVYNLSGDLAGGWEVSSLTKYNKYQVNGLQAAMYQRTKEDGNVEYSYVYAGTVTGEDWVNNLSQPFGLSSQYDDVSKLSSTISKNLGGLELTWVGHSLGGGLANLSSLMTGRSSITFNPAWLQRFAYNKKVKLGKGKHQWNFVHENDPLDNIQRTAGWAIGLKETGKTFEVDGGWNPLKNNQIFGHFMNTMTERMRANGQATHHGGNKDDSIKILNPRDF